MLVNAYDGIEGDVNNELEALLDDSNIAIQEAGGEFIGLIDSLSTGIPPGMVANSTLNHPLGRLFSRAYAKCTLCFSDVLHLGNGQPTEMRVLMAALPVIPHPVALGHSTQRHSEPGAFWDVRSTVDA